MRIKTQDYNNVTVVELQGELDGDFADLLRDTITDIITANKTGIVLDMSVDGCRSQPFVNPVLLESFTMFVCDSIGIGVPHSCDEITHAVYRSLGS